MIYPIQIVYIYSNVFSFKLWVYYHNEKLFVADLINLINLIYAIIIYGIQLYVNNKTYIFTVIYILVELSVILFTFYPFVVIIFSATIVKGRFFVLSNNSISPLQGKNSIDIQRENRSLIVKMLMRHKTCTRISLAEMTSLTQAAITKIISDLIEYQIIEEIGTRKGSRGRSKILLSLKENNILLIGVKLARTSFTTAVFDITGRVYVSNHSNIKKTDNPQKVINHIRKNIHNYLAQYKNIIAIGAAVPGPFLRFEGRISKMTEFAGWENFNIVEAISNDMPIPVFVEHDANAGALAEWWFGEKNPDVLVFLLASEGIGAGIIDHGKLLLGNDGIAGEIGHISIDMNGRKCHCAPNKRGCLEQYCSSLSFTRDVIKELPRHPDSILYPLLNSKMTVENVFYAAKKKDEFAQSMVDQVAYYFGIGVSSIANIYNPSTIIISDIMTQGGERMLNIIRQTAKEQMFPPLFDRLHIRYSSLPCDPILLGAMTVAAEHFLDNPVDFIRPNLNK